MQRIAEALVECGYANGHVATKERTFVFWEYRSEEDVNPFADTLPGRRQADALMDFLRDVDGKNMLLEYLLECNDTDNWLGEFDSRKATIKWCFKKLENKL